ncbi:TetR family transcriptional regulator C-terminal domain-containing protein [Stappia taiwanensis]|uniref:TetR family transcriptional regulator C-terminal domain-containing protein n=1 Tax=Stappia taiwanensis TaxID=992267 RepID=A0A838XXQ0_9HYPH|nr:TetR/AcrR family transcriptional regulator [Stappia taiwanensis]MBA4611814.1 TetR family transcriptional regulator C-terminal domain-containing protein [Stappia taiwanensis]GGF02958.1 TetR family transcriptional regulator [Stappia taiwanensis]
MAAKQQARQTQKSAARAENERAILAAAEEVFAESGFRGATTGMIAERAGLPKANLHYYFPTKEALYRKVVEHIFTIWLDAANSFDENDDPVEALTAYISTKMDISRAHPMGSKVWANEILHKAPVIQDYLETTLRSWTSSRVAVIDRWVAEGRIAPVNGEYLLYMIWATTQHYADFNHQIDTLNGGAPLSDAQFEEAKQTVVRIVLAGIGAVPAAPGGEGSQA